MCRSACRPASVNLRVLAFTPRPLCRRGTVSVPSDQCTASGVSCLSRLCGSPVKAITASCALVLLASSRAFPASPLADVRHRGEHGEDLLVADGPGLRFGQDGLQGASDGVLCVPRSSPWPRSPLVAVHAFGLASFALASHRAPNRPQVPRVRARLPLRAPADLAHVLRSTLARHQKSPLSFRSALRPIIWLSRRSVKSSQCPHSRRSCRDCWFLSSAVRKASSVIGGCGISQPPRPAEGSATY
jgi:hypothetical protein